jgi:hypothetical protein
MSSFGSRDRRGERRGCHLSHIQRTSERIGINLFQSFPNLLSSRLLPDLPPRTVYLHILEAKYSWSVKVITRLHPVLMLAKCQGRTLSEQNLVTGSWRSSSLLTIGWKVVQSPSSWKNGSFDCTELHPQKVPISGSKLHELLGYVRTQFPPVRGTVWTGSTPTSTGCEVSAVSRGTVYSTCLYLRSIPSCGYVTTFLANQHIQWFCISASRCNCSI